MNLNPARYGWAVVAAAFVVMFLGFGVAYAFAAFFRTFEVEFAADRGDISLIFALCGFLYFSLGAVSGPLADRIGPRPVALFGMLLIAVGLYIASLATTLGQIYLSYGIAVGVGVGFSYVPAVGAVQRWFTEKRAMASGIAVSGIGFGTLAMPPLAGLLIAAFDWRQSYQIFAVATLVGGGIAAYFLAPPGRQAARHSPLSGAVLQGATLRQAFRSRPFWMIYIASMTNSFAIFVPFVHLVPFAVDRGHSETVGLWLMGMIGVGSILGRFVIGAIADRFGRRRTFTSLFAGIAVMLVWWWAAEAVWALAVFAVIFGSLYGGFVALAPALTTDYFGGRQISGILGFIYSGVGVGTLIGPTVAGMAFDRFQAYDLPIFGAAAMTLISVLCTGVFLREPDPSRWIRPGGEPSPDR